MKNTRFVHDEYSSDNIVAQSTKAQHVSKHYHSLLEIYYVTNGQIEVVVNNQSKILCKDQLCICDSFDEHSYTHVSPNANSVFVTIPDSLTTRLEVWKRHKKFKENFITDYNIAQKFKSFIDLILEQKTNNSHPLYAEGLALSLLGLVLEYLPLSEDDEANKTILSSVVQYINNHFTEKLTLSDICKHFGYSKYYFSKLFNKNFKCHFNDYVNSIRCRNVISLLNSSGKQTILTAILNSGFSSPSSFYKFFNKNYNISPSEIRNIKIEELDKHLKD